VIRNLLALRLVPLLERLSSRATVPSPHGDGPSPQRGLFLARVSD